MERKVQAYLAEIGRRGGKKSRRALAPETARNMVRVRESPRLSRKSIELTLGREAAEADIFVKVDTRMDTYFE